MTAGPWERVLLAAWLGLSVIFAGVFIIEEHIHDHTGEDCTICLEIQIALRLIEALVRLGVCTAAAVFFAYILVLVKPAARVLAVRPALLHIKLNC